jgi:hypothetical protein
MDPVSWTCPDCDRRFARTRQSHLCAPALTLDEYFSTGPPWERAVFDAVLDHVTTLGPIHVEPVSVGVFLKASGSLFELRTKTRWSALSFPLPREVRDRRIARKPVRSGKRIYHVVNLATPDDVDDQVRDWLTESYAAYA